MCDEVGDEITERGQPIQHSGLSDRCVVADGEQADDELLVSDSGRRCHRVLTAGKGFDEAQLPPEQGRGRSEGACETTAVGGPELPLQPFGIAPGHHLLRGHRHRSGQAKQRMSRNGIGADGHAEAAAGPDGHEEGLLPVLEMPRQSPIGEPGPVLLVDDSGDDARTDRHEQIPTSEPPRRVRPYGIEVEIDDLACTHAPGGADDDARELLESPREDGLPSEREPVGRAEVEMELEVIHVFILVPTQCRCPCLPSVPRPTMRTDC